MLHRRVILLVSLCLILVLFWFLWRATWRIPLKTPRPLSYHDGKGLISKSMLSESCTKWTYKYVSLEHPAMIIDEEILRIINQETCEDISFNMSMMIAVDTVFKEKMKTHDNFEIVYFTNQTHNDYLELFVDQQNKKIIPKNIQFQTVGHLMVPTQIPLFLEFLRRGTFRNCRNMTMDRDTTRNKYTTIIRNIFFPPRKPIPAKESVENLAKLRDEMLLFGIFPFLNGGSFLGWYRECSVIPHTTDMDIAVFEENWNEEFFEFLWTHNSNFRVKRQLGLVNDSYELTIVPKLGFKTPIDVFLMYKDYESGKNNRWVGGLSTFGVKYKYIYSDYDPWCAATLMGHLFWVSCTPEDKIEKEYGTQWHLDENSSKYIWNAARNSLENGQFTRKQMETETYNEYKTNE